MQPQVARAQQGPVEGTVPHKEPPSGGDCRNRSNPSSALHHPGPPGLGRPTTFAQLEPLAEANAAVELPSSFHSSSFRSSSLIFLYHVCLVVGTAATVPLRRNTI